MKHIYSTGIIYDCRLRSSKYNYNTGHCLVNDDLIKEKLHFLYAIIQVDGKQGTGEMAEEGEREQNFL